MAPASGPAVGKSRAILLTRRLKVKAQLAKSLDQAGVERLWTSVLQTKDRIRVPSDFLTDSPNTTHEFSLCTCGCGGYKSPSSPAQMLTVTPDFFSRICSCSPRVYTVYAVYTIYTNYSSIKTHS